MISRETALRFLNKHVSILVDGRFFKGILTIVGHSDIVLKFNGIEQAYALEKIERIQEGA